MNPPKKLTNVFWNNYNNIYKKMKTANNLDELKDIYDDIWFNVEKPIEKQATKYFYLYIKHQMDNQN